MSAHLEIEYKYLLPRTLDPLGLFVQPVSTQSIHQVYLYPVEAKVTSERVRIVEDVGGKSKTRFFHTKKMPSPVPEHDAESFTAHLEEENEITAAAFVDALTRRIPGAITIHKYRRVFHHTSRTVPFGSPKVDKVELDSFTGPLTGLHIAEVETHGSNEPWVLHVVEVLGLSIERNVSKDKRYSNLALALAGRIPTETP